MTEKITTVTTTTRSPITKLEITMASGYKDKLDHIDYSTVINHHNDAISATVMTNMIKEIEWRKAAYLTTTKATMQMRTPRTIWRSAPVPKIMQGNQKGGLQ